MPQYRAVFHLVDGGRARVGRTLASIEELLVGLGDGDVEVALIASGEGVMALLRSPDLHGAKIDRLAAKGVRFMACASTLRHMGLAKEALVAPVELVPSGISEVVRKQAEGWAYIRP